MASFSIANCQGLRWKGPSFVMLLSSSDGLARPAGAPLRPTLPRRCCGSRMAQQLQMAHDHWWMGQVQMRRSSTYGVTIWGAVSLAARASALTRRAVVDGDYESFHRKGGGQPVGARRRQCPNLSECPASWQYGPFCANRGRHAVNQKCRESRSRNYLPPQMSKSSTELLRKSLKAYQVSSNVRF